MCLLRIAVHRLRLSIPLYPWLWLPQTKRRTSNYSLRGYILLFFMLLWCLVNNFGMNKSGNFLPTRTIGDRVFLFSGALEQATISPLLSALYIACAFCGAHLSVSLMLQFKSLPLLCFYSLSCLQLWSSCLFLDADKISRMLWGRVCMTKEHFILL